MSIFDLVKNVFGDSQTAEEVVGTIVEGPRRIENGDASKEFLAFKLDSLPEIEFRQEVRALAPERKRGDLVKVHYHVQEDGIATVEWIERA